VTAEAEESRRLRDLISDDPSLAKDLLRWAESAQTVGPNGVFAAYRHGDEADPTLSADATLAPGRRCGSSPTINRLYHADNLAVLPTLMDEGVSARCIYIDPPYGTQQQFARKATDNAAYCDAASGGAYLAAFRKRLALLRDVLDEEGSLFVHLDASMVAEVKLLLDEVFGPSNFRAWISRRKCSSKNYTRKTFGDITDYVLFYSKTAGYLFNRQYGVRDEAQEAIDFPKVDQKTGRRFALVPIHAPGRRNGATGSEWRGMLPPAGKHWQTTPDKLDEYDAKGDIYWTRNGTPRRKIWAKDSQGSAIANLWHDFRDPFNQNFATTGYPTEKNLDLLRLIVSAASNPGDLVLDCYAGSGTTLAAAGALGRRWIGIDSGTLAVALAQRRLAEAALAPDLLAAASPGFEVFSTDLERRNSPAIAKPEFGFLETCNGGSSVPEVQEVLGPSLMASRALTLAPGEQLIAFDHDGREAVYDGSDSIQLIEKRPA
jgi:adenine-specific DNA-methyltransferase